MALAYLMIAVAGTVQAQTENGTNSPYSRYGFGALSDQHFGNSKAMGGIAYGLRNGFQINATNPASYTAVDSLTFLFDAGFSLQNANFKEGKHKVNAKNSSIDYIAMQFRLSKRLSLSAGFLPFSSVGYQMSQTEVINKKEYNQDIATGTSYTGTGGLNQIYAGLGYKVFKNLSIGANISYLYGDIAHTVTKTFSDPNATKSVKSETLSIDDYKLDAGIQYSFPIKDKHVINVGAVYSLGLDLNGKGYNIRETYAADGYIPATQAIDTISNAFAIPHSFGAGFTYVYDNKLTVGFDYTLQKWQDVKFFNKENCFTDRSRYSIGAEYQPDALKRNYFSRIRYRVGAYYADPYAKIDGKEGNREYGVSFGFGLPLFQSRSVLNISGQYVKVSPKVKGMLEENYLRINIGLTFNERWFMKWKVD